MEIFKKVYWLIYPLLIVVFMLTFDALYQTESFALKIITCGGLAFILSPRKKIIKTQAGNIKQITWVFFKTPIQLNS